MYLQQDEPKESKILDDPLQYELLQPIRPDSPVRSNIWDHRGNLSPSRGKT